MIIVVSLAHSSEGFKLVKRISGLCLSVEGPCMHERQKNIVVKRMNFGIRGRVLIQPCSETLSKLYSMRLSFDAVKWEQ